MEMKEDKPDQGQDQEAQLKGESKIGLESAMNPSQKSLTWIISEVVINIFRKVCIIVVLFV